MHDFPWCHYQGCREPAADTPSPTHGDTAAFPVPLCARHQERYALTARGRRSRDWVIDLLRDQAGHRQLTVRAPWRRELRGAS